MFAEKLRTDDDGRRNKLTLRPQIALIEKQPPVTFFDEAGRPRFGSPGRVEFLLLEQRELVWVCHRHDHNVTALVSRLHAVRLEPGTQCDVLRVAHLRRGHAFTVKIFRLLNAGIVTNYKCSAAAGRTR